MHHFSRRRTRSLWLSHKPRRCQALVFSLSLAIASAASAGVFTVVNTNATGPGSFAQALHDSIPQPDSTSLIKFNIPGAGVHKINVRELLIVSRDTTIDGYTQPGAHANTLAQGSDAVILIQLDGGGPPFSAPGALGVMESNNTIRGLSLTGFDTALVHGYISLNPENGNRLEGSFIGLEPDGVTVNGNVIGVDVMGDYVFYIGGNTPAARNVFAGNRIAVRANGTFVGNYFGTDATGQKQGYGNGIAIQDLGAATIGTAAPGSGNVITGNDTGIAAFSPAIQGNLIGTTADGGASFGNTIGIQVLGYGGIIGGLEPAEGNVIAYNGTGVRIYSSDETATRSEIVSNSFYANLDHDIDLGKDGATPNDLGDADAGPNNLQNFPVISSVSHAPGQTIVSGGLNSAPSSSYLLQFFANQPASQPGQKFLGSEMVTTNTAGDASFQFTFPVATGAEDFVTATATDAQRNTSEFFPPDGTVALANLSTRGYVGTDDDVLIGGYIHESFRDAPVLIRALGPSLNVNGALADPQIDIRYSDGSLALTNHSWRESQEKEIRATGLAPQDDREAAVIFQPSPQARFTIDNPITVQVSGEDGGTGIATVEFYRLPVGPYSEPMKFLNLSTRGRVGAGDGVLIAGTIVDGSAAQKVIVRAIGPDLATQGVAAPLEDPTLELHDAEGTLFAANDDWRSDQEQAINATGVAPKDDRDAAIVATLLPSSYTAIVRGKDGAVGTAVVEIYALD